MVRTKGRGGAQGKGEKRQGSATTAPAPDKALAMAMHMPELAGRGLEAPSFHGTDWHVNQCFTAKDNPDRTRVSWRPPKFVSYKDPALQEAVAEELRLPRDAEVTPGFQSSFAQVVRNVLDEEDCAELIASVNAKGFTPALLNIGGGNQQLVPGARDGHRVIVDSPELAEWLLGVILPFLPQELEDGSRLAEMNERLRFLCYTPGQEFPAHFDGCYERRCDDLHGGGPAQSSA